MRERKSERFNIIFLSHFVQLIYCRVLMKKKMKNTHLATLYSILFRLVIVTECIIILEREKGREKGRERGERKRARYLSSNKSQIVNSVMVSLNGTEGSQDWILEVANLVKFNPIATLYNHYSCVNVRCNPIFFD